MQVLKTPGVYIQEVATLPPSVAEVSTAIPIFIGHTERGDQAARITSLLDYQAQYGSIGRSRFTVDVGAAADGTEPPLSLQRETAGAPTSLFYHLSHYFMNGGGPCWIVPIGRDGTVKDRFLAGLARVEQEDEPTLILFPEAATLLDMADYCELAQAALLQCNRLKDRFTILDVPGGNVAGFRDAIGTANLSYGAAYHPAVQTSIAWQTDDDSVSVRTAPSGGATTFARAHPAAGDGITASFAGVAGDRPRLLVVGGDGAQPVSFTITGTRLEIGNAEGRTGADIITAWTAFAAANPTGNFTLAANGSGAAAVAPTSATGVELASQAEAPVPLTSLRTSQTALYNRIRDALARERVTLSPSAAIAGVYAAVDRDRGVWKAPANVSLAGVIGPTVRVTDEAQQDLNVDATAGKSINVIRAFTGKGTLVWGARTLAGNDNEWRYVPVRRLFITVEESVKKASAFAVFEPNDANTWLKVKGMIDSYLYTLWERGALAGSKPDQAYFVNVGLGRTMTTQDVLEGKLIVEIGIAAVRPAEFILLRFMHKLQQA